MPGVYQSLLKFSLLFGITAAASPLQLYWPAETAILATGLAGDWAGLHRLARMTPPAPADLNKSNLAPWDRPAAGNYNPAAAKTSDLLVGLVGGAMAGADGWTLLRSRTGWAPAFEDGVILSEILAWSSALSMNVRALALHPRPLVYGSRAPQSEREDPKNAGSFYSGHASEAFAGAVYLSRVYPLRHPEFKHRALLWSGSLAAASLVAGLRVVAGKHFTSDIVTGATVGSLLGWGFVEIHRTRGEGTTAPSGGWRILPGFPAEGLALTLVKQL